MKRTGGTGRVDDTIPLRRRILYSAVVVPGFFLCVEVLLWIAGVEPLLERGDPSRGFSGLMSIYVRDGDHYRTRDLHGQQTFNRESFLRRKPGNGFRIFTLGESSSYGFPWGGSVAFPALLGHVLAVQHPDRVVESINASGTSYGMHRLRIVARELLDYEPDLFLIYSGHNEFVEPAFYQAFKERGAARSRLTHLLSGWRLYSFLSDALSPALPDLRGESAPYDLTVQRDQGLVFSSSEKSEIARRYEEGLRALVREARAQRVRVVLCTVPCNLRDWRPQRSVTATDLPASGATRFGHLLREGGRLLEAGKYAEAEKTLREALAQAPQHAEAHYLLGRACEGLGRWEEARQAYDRAADLDASPIRRTSAINDAVRRVARDESVVLIDIEEAFRSLSEHGLIGFNLIEDYVHPTRESHRLIAWEIDKAIEQAGWLGAAGDPDRSRFDTVLASRAPLEEGANAMWLYNQGVVFYQQGRSDLAMEKYRQALQLDPGYAGARINLGHLLLQSGDVGGAISQFQAVVETDPSQAEAQANLGVALHLAGRVEESIRHLRRAVELGPGPRSHHGLGRSLEAAGDHEGAMAAYREAIRLDAEYAQAHTDLGALLLSRGRAKEAADELREAVRLNPDSADARYNLGLALKTQRAHREAIEEFRRAIEIDPGFAKARHGLGSVLRAEGRLDEAIQQLTEAAHLTPSDPVLLSNLGSALQVRGDLRGAAERFQRALEIDPALLEARFNLGVALLLQDRTREARPYLLEAAAKNPRMTQLLRYLSEQWKVAPDVSGRSAARARVLDAIAEEIAGGDPGARPRR